MRSWLKRLRTEKNLTQSNIAEIMQISRQQYSFIELGKRQAKLELATASKLSEIFGISLDDIRTFEEREPQK